MKSECISLQTGVHVGLIGFLVELCLTIHGIGTGHPADIAAVRLLHAGVAVVGQHRVKDVLQTCLQSRSRDRSRDFHAAERRAGHPVCRADVVPGTLSLSENVDAGMLQIAAHDADDMDILGLIRDTGTQAADAAHHHIDVDARLTCLDELVDEHFVGQAVDLDADVAALAAGGSFDLTVYPIQQTVL